MATVTKTAALALFTALGLTNADKWNAKRLAAKLGKVDEMVDEKTKLGDKDADKTLTVVLKAIAANEEITVEEEAVAPAAKSKAKAAPAEADPQAEMAKAKAAKKAAKPAAAPKEPKAPTTPGVRETKTRPYLAGVIIAKHGADAGVTEAMAKELDEAYGKQNPTESLFCLRNAWHAVRGHKDAAKK